MNSKLPPAAPAASEYAIIFHARDQSVAEHQIVWTEEMIRAMETSREIEEVRRVAETLMQAPQVTLFVSGQDTTAENV